MACEQAFSRGGKLGKTAEEGGEDSLHASYVVLWIPSPKPRGVRSVKSYPLIARRKYEKTGCWQASTALYAQGALSVYFRQRSNNFGSILQTIYVCLLLTPKKSSRELSQNFWSTLHNFSLIDFWNVLEGSLTSSDENFLSRFWMLIFMSSPWLAFECNCNCCCCCCCCCCCTRH